MVLDANLSAVPLFWTAARTMVLFDRISSEASRNGTSPRMRLWGGSKVPSSSLPLSLSSSLLQENEPILSLSSPNKNLVDSLRFSCADGVVPSSSLWLLSEEFCRELFMASR